MSNITESPTPLISELADDEDMVELVEMFVSELPDRVAALEKALGDQDLDTLATLAHQLKGSAGGYGFPTITEAAKQLELTAKAQDDLDKLHAKCAALTSLCHQARSSAPQD